MLSCYLHISLTGQKIIVDFEIIFQDVQIGNVSAATGVRKVPFWIAYFLYWYETLKTYCVSRNGILYINQNLIFHQSDQLKGLSIAKLKIDILT